MSETQNPDADVLEDVLASINQETMKLVDKDTTDFTKEYAFTYGIPSTPRELLFFAIAQASNTLAYAIARGTASLAPDSLSSESEKAEMKARFGDIMKLHKLKNTAMQQQAASVGNKGSVGTGVYL